jgi:hypothetical protein
MNECPVCEVFLPTVPYEEPMKETLPICTKLTISEMQSQILNSRTVGEVVLALHKSARYSDIPKEAWDKIILASRCGEPL